MMHFVGIALSALPVGLRCFRNARRVMARHANIVPWRFVARICAMCWSFARGSKAEWETPAALMRMSTLSYVFK